MGKSRIKDRWIREEQKKVNLKNGINPRANTEIPRKNVGSFIEKRLKQAAYFLESSTSFGGHRRRPYGTSLMNGILRMKLKKEARREIEEDQTSNC